MQRHKLAVISLIVIAVLAVIVVWAWVSKPWHISNLATVKTVGVEVYWDSELRQNVTTINWGVLEPGENKTVSIYIKSVSNVPSTLNMSTSNWMPSDAVLYISLSWNYTGTVLNPNDVILVDFTLSVSPSITGITNFTFDLSITAQG